MTIPMEDKMADTKATPTINPQDNATLNAREADPFRKVTLVEMIMILMLTGLILVFIFGLQQMKIDKQKEAEAQQKFEAVVPILTDIIQKMEDYKKADEFGDYPIDLGEIGTFKDENFEFKYDPENHFVQAVSKESFGKAGVIVNYSLTNSVYEVIDDKPGEKPTVKDDWLP
jgi:competence protein ComGC